MGLTSFPSPHGDMHAQLGTTGMAQTGPSEITGQPGVVCRSAMGYGAGNRVQACSSDRRTTIGTMSELMTADRRATFDEIVARRVELRELSSKHRFGSVRVAADGMIIVHSDGPGYRELARFAGEASRLVGAYVQVITDDVAAGSVPAKPL